MKSVGGISAIGAPLAPNGIGQDNFVRRIGDRLIFDFHEGGGRTVRDLSGNDNNGRLSDKNGGINYPTWQRFRLNFDGINNYVSCGNNASLVFGNGSKDRSFSLLIMMSQTGTTNDFPHILGKDGGTDGVNREYSLLFLVRYKVYLYLLDRFTDAYLGKYSLFDTITNNQRLLVASTYSGNGTTIGMKIYVDSIEIINISLDTWAVYTAMGNTRTNLRIGMKGNNTFGFQGHISFTRITASVLSEIQILQDYFFCKWRN